MLVKCFWACLTFAVVLAFVETGPRVRWVAVGLLLAFGSLCSLGNWWVVYSNKFRGTSSSFVPLVGGLILLIGLLRAPSQTLHYLAVAVPLLDVSILVWLFWGLSLFRKQLRPD